ncbi:MAG: hypothetical protein GF353_27035 [Candidatus Lokiarchaeota archaeon]|nr:hypothetical protein [Candidatus Lokiarchaeota archaeon]
MIPSDLLVTDIIAGFCYGAFTIIFVIIGLRMALKYFEHNRAELISVGIAWILVSSSAWDNFYYFIHMLLIGEPSYLFFTFLVYTFRLGLPMALFLWMFSVTKLIPMQNRIKLFVILIHFILLIISIILYILALITLFTDLLGIAGESLFMIIYFSFITITGVILMISTLTSGFFIARNASKSNDPRFKLESKFLLSAFIISSLSMIVIQIALASSGEGGVYDQYHLAPAITTIFVLMHITLVISAILFYLGFFLSERLYRWLKKSE